MDRQRDRATALGLIQDQPAKKLHLSPPPLRAKRPGLLKRIWRRLFAAKTWPACQSGPCAGGTRLCLTPVACRLAERGDR